MNIENELPLALKKVFNKYGLYNSDKITILKTTNTFNIKNLKNLDIFINLEKINNLRRINKFHYSVNNVLINDGIYCSCAETMTQRKNRKWEKHFFLISPLVLFIDFIYKRITPKLPFIKQIYFALTRGYNRVLSKTEILGRLNASGFQTLELIENDNLSYIISKKVRKPFFDKNPSYGPIFKMKRVGFNKKLIKIYKFRTMYPFSEYLQKEIIEKNSLQEGGKVKNDFRITFYGKFMRKFWLDELPMLLNLIKRDIKIVGVRPLSEDYFTRYPKYLQNMRIKYKPGLIPPYYVDLPVTFEEICESERIYLERYSINPIKTDILYFFKALWNILIKRKRSQ